MSRPTANSRGNVPYLPKQRIEAEADRVLAEYGESHGEVTAPPVPIDEIIELHLKLTFEVEDLEALLGHEDVLGAVWFTEQIIRVDSSLDPHDNQRMLGRYRFTLAHEAGHWCLHRSHYREDPNQLRLFDGRGQPAFICRSSEKPPAEWQADRFAGYLLMPHEMAYREWETWRGDPTPVYVEDPDAPTQYSDKKRNQSIAMERFCRPFADGFEVSAVAMRIRLGQLGLLLRQKPNTLF